MIVYVVAYFMEDGDGVKVFKKKRDAIAYQKRAGLVSGDVADCWAYPDNKEHWVSFISKNEVE